MQLSSKYKWGKMFTGVMDQEGLRLRQEWGKTQVILNLTVFTWT